MYSHLTTVKLLMTVRNNRSHAICSPLQAVGPLHCEVLHIDISISEVDFFRMFHAKIITAHNPTFSDFNESW
jgi:hypothetical protein